MDSFLRHHFAVNFWGEERDAVAIFNILGKDDSILLFPY